MPLLVTVIRAGGGMYMLAILSMWLLLISILQTTHSYSEFMLTLTALMLFLQATRTPPYPSSLSFRAIVNPYMLKDVSASSQVSESTMMSGACSLISSSSSSFLPLILRQFHCIIFNELGLTIEDGGAQRP